MLRVAIIGTGNDFDTPNRLEPTRLNTGITLVGKKANIPAGARIGRNVRIGEAPSYGRPVIHHDPHCAGSDAYFELAKEVAARG